MPDEFQSLQRTRILAPLIACAAFCLGQRADLFIVAYRWYLDAGQPGHFSDAQHEETS